jgi:signal transduction histidine kinase
VKLAHIAVSAVILLGVFAWIWSHDMKDDMQTSERALRALDAFAIAESELHRDLLSARAGMLRNYDFLVHEDRSMRAALEQIPEHGRLAALVDQEGELVERFKSRNALLQNSLAYFQLFSTRLVTHQGPLAQGVSGLTSAMLQLTLDTSPGVVTNVDAHLAELSALSLPAQDATLTESLLAHARLLREVLPATDSLLKSLFSLPSASEQQRIREQILERQRIDQTRARRARYALIATSLLLLALLAQVAMQLRARAQSLRRRAAMEHLIAGISTRFISSRPHETDTLIEQALTELAHFIAADRAYFLVSDGQARLCKWCGPNNPFPPRWPEAALALAREVRVNSEGVIEVHQAGEAHRPAVKDALAAAAVTTWLCVPNKGGEQVEILLAFDYVGSHPSAQPRELGLLRMALDAICNAVERHGLEQDRERLEANLQHARRMETIGALASGIAHNFNNIVGAILGFAETAQPQVPATNRVAASLSEIRRAGERARDLVDQILTFGRRRAVRRTQISVREWIDEARSLLEATLPPHVRLLVRESSPGVMVYGELTSLQQVILNVCNNAAQAMDTPGTVEIRIATRELESSGATEPCGLAAGRYVVVSVTDPGRGMDEATLERVFEPFFTTRAEGNGLGLALVREVISEHGGTVRIRSTPGAGTRVDIWLPCGESQSSTESEFPEAVDRGGGEAVLVLEANRERLLRHEEILAALGYEPVGFTGVTEAEAALLADPTRCDVALICARSQDSTAVLTWVAALRKQASQLPIVLATSAPADFAAPALAEAGVTAVIGQPLNSAELAGALGRCLTHRRASLQSQELSLSP